MHACSDGSISRALVWSLVALLACMSCCQHDALNTNRQLYGQCHHASTIHTAALCHLTHVQVVRAMRQLATRRRLALTGYPLQNNLDEYYELIRWVSVAEHH
jgi:hypothetical protein